MACAHLAVSVIKDNNLVFREGKFSLSSTLFPFPGRQCKGQEAREEPCCDYLRATTRAGRASMNPGPTAQPSTAAPTRADAYTKRLDEKIGKLTEHFGNIIKAAQVGEKLQTSTEEFQIEVQTANLVHNNPFACICTISDLIFRWAQANHCSFLSQR